MNTDDIEKIRIRKNALFKNQSLNNYTNLIQRIQKTCVSKCFGELHLYAAVWVFILHVCVSWALTSSRRGACLELKASEMQWKITRKLISQQSKSMH